MVTYPAPICLGCVRLRATSPGLTCSAFPDGIPEAIRQSRVDHRYPYADDEGQYAWRDVAAQAYADQRFGPLGEDVIDYYGEAGRALFAKMVQVGLDGGSSDAESRRFALDIWPITILAMRLQPVTRIAEQT